MRIKHVKKWAVLMAALLVFSSFAFVSESGTPAYAQTVEELEAEKDRLASEIESAEADIAALQDQSGDIQSRLDQLAAEQMIQKDAYETLKQQLEEARAKMEEAIRAYQSSVRDVEQKQLEYEQRVSSMFKVRHKSTLEVLLSSDSIASFFTNMQLMNYISSTDHSMLEQLERARIECQLRKETAEQTKASYDRYVADQEALLDNIAAGIASAEDEMAKLKDSIQTREADRSEYSGQMAATTAELDSAIEAYRQELARQKAAEEAAEEAEKGESGASSSGSNGGSTSHGGDASMIYPLPNYTEISSYFGTRDDPFGGSSYGMHWGVDFPAPAGTPIRAAQSGTVITASYPLQGCVTGYTWDGYGNYVAIANADGIVCIYAHMMEGYVSEGQYVEQGSVIGAVGSTGESTGCHLHFQVSVPWSDEKAVDPLQFLP